VTAPPLWRAFEWVGRKAGVPDFMWQMGFVLWFILPGLIVVAVLTIQKRHGGDYQWQ
jgi:hypothetical protein